MLTKSMVKCALAAISSIAVCILLVAISGCTKDAPVAGTASVNPAAGLDKHGLPMLAQVNLVADNSSFAPKVVDAGLTNAWGIAATPTGRIWISANHSGLSVIYDTAGNLVRPPVTIPSEASSTGGAPTGALFNPTTQFVVPGTSEVSHFIFASEDGIISAWSSGSGAKIAADRSSFDAVYKGIAMALNGSHHFLYATNFKGAKVDVFDEQFNYDSTFSFKDPGIPAGFAPFNIQNIGGNLFVTYAMQKGPDNEDDQAGPGFGYVDIYRPDGSLIRRFASGGTLNSPWGLERVPSEGFGRLNGAILVGNFGDGRINAFQRSGEFIGQLSDVQGNPVFISGLWALSFVGAQARVDSVGHEGDNEDGDQHDGDGGDGGGDGQGEDGGHQQTQIGNATLEMVVTPRLFFTAGPNDESDGIFGYLKGVR